jgi:hypothetical protein
LFRSVCGGVVRGQNQACDRCAAYAQRTAKQVASSGDYNLTSRSRHQAGVQCNDDADSRPLKRSTCSGEPDLAGTTCFNAPRRYFLVGVGVSAEVDSGATGLNMSTT